jgi:hypothetical protein
MAMRNLPPHTLDAIARQEARELAARQAHTAQAIQTAARGIRRAQARHGTEAVGLPSVTESPNSVPEDAAPAGTEDELQAAAYEYFQAIGFLPRNFAPIKTFRPGTILPSGVVHRGWYLHLHETRENPLVLDCLLTDTITGRFLELELKCRGGAIREHQLALCHDYGYGVCYCLRQVRELVSYWLQQGEAKC